ncbi:MAG: alpha-ketoglutarate-dependent dioxygenase AlkB [Proteobacteria bacterium]|nr:MAG: alpha-ketoglutarate-dependent dioxygenase AlkB [Pseudomonadota bacterium]
MLQFEEYFEPEKGPQAIADGAVFLQEFARSESAFLIEEIRKVVAKAPFREAYTKGGLRMSLTSTGCGAIDWLDDEEGRISSPALGPALRAFAVRAATAAGYPDFMPNACLINRYLPGAKLGLHQDREETDTDEPIVSVSLGLPITFLFGGLDRSDPTQRIALDHGDVIVWGGASRMAFHGVLTLKDGQHPILGRQRINLTFRKIKV